MKKAILALMVAAMLAGVMAMPIQAGVKEFEQVPPRPNAQN
jgi:hypothetical protein